jgi:hypothetical protein
MPLCRIFRRPISPYIFPLTQSPYFSRKYASRNNDYQLSFCIPIPAFSLFSSAVMLIFSSQKVFATLFKKPFNQRGIYLHILMPNDKMIGTAKGSKLSRVVSVAK